MEEVSTLISQQFTNVGILEIEQVRQYITRLVNFKTNVSIKRIAAMVKEQKIFMPDSVGCRIADAGYLSLTKKRKVLEPPTGFEDYFGALKKDGSVSSKSRYRIVCIRRYPKTHPKICDRDNLKTRHITNAIAEAFGVADRAEKVSFMDTVAVSFIMRMVTFLALNRMQQRRWYRIYSYFLKLL